MRRVPIRARVTLAFAAVMAVVLTAVGLFLYLRLEAQLDASIEQGLRSRATEITALIEQQATGLGASDKGSLIEQEESFAQVLTPDGRVVDSTPQLGEHAVLSEADLRRTDSEPDFYEREGLPGIEGTARLLAAPVEAGGRELVLVVGSSLEDSNEALANLRRLLLIGGPIALLLASLAGYGVAAVSLRPVDAMRRRAAEISATEPNERLPVPEARDELARLGETLNAMLARLEAAIERERRFVNDASHELRTPLALHRTELEVALRYARDERELRTAIGSAIGEIDRLVQLAEDLLVVARAEGGELAITHEDVAVEDLFATVRDRFAARVAESDRDLRIDGSDGARVAGDRVRLEQALTNLVDNALRHGAGDVRLWLRADRDHVELHVGDAGAGFPAEFIERAFERFTRADAARGRGGTGLGLAIVATIAAAHGGAARAANPPGGGADVWIELPAARG